MIFILLIGGNPRGWTPIGQVLIDVGMYGTLPLGPVIGCRHVNQWGAVIVIFILGQWGAVGKLLRLVSHYFKHPKMHPKMQLQCPTDFNGDTHNVNCGAYSYGHGFQILVT